MGDFVVANYVAPVANATFVAIQLLKPFIIQYENGIRLDD
jgi:hypothetical protein